MSTYREISGMKRIYRMPIHRNMILSILRNRNEDKILRTEGIPDDAEVRGAEMIDGEHLVLYVETCLAVEGDVLHVVTHDRGPLYVNGKLQKEVIEHGLRKA